MRPTLTSAGRVIPGAFVCGPAEALRGVARQAEIYRRFRRAHSVRWAARLTVTAYRHGGVFLSGEAK